MSESSRSVPMPMWMGIIVVLLLLLNLIFLLVGKSEKPSSGPIVTSDEVKRIITRENMDFALVVSKDGLVVPVTAEGKDYALCSAPNGREQKKDICSLYRGDGVKVKKIEQLALTKHVYQFNPTCIAITIMHEGVLYQFYDPTDPACAGVH